MMAASLVITGLVLNLFWPRLLERFKSSWVLHLYQLRKWPLSL
jgi:hypothetical protein